MQTPFSIRKEGIDVGRKTGFDNGICRDCAYNKNGRCKLCHQGVRHITQCPEGYTYEMMREIAEFINARLSRSYELKRSV